MGGEPSSQQVCGQDVPGQNHYIFDGNADLQTRYQQKSKHLKGQLGPPVSDEKYLSGHENDHFQGQLGPPVSDNNGCLSVIKNDQLKACMSVFNGLSLLQDNLQKVKQGNTFKQVQKHTTAKTLPLQVCD